MRLCATLLFLTALTWTRADPVPSPASAADGKKCELEIISDKETVSGRHNFVVGFGNNKFVQTLLGATSSIWANVTQLENENEFHVIEFKKMNGTCVKHQFNMTMDGQRGKSHTFGMETEIQLRKLNENATVMELNASTTNIVPIMKKLGLDPKKFLGEDHEESVPMDIHQYFLISRGSDVTETDLEQFTENAHCIGFQGNPPFHYKSDEEFCTEGTIVFQ